MYRIDRIRKRCGTLFLFILLILSILLESS